MGKKAMSLVELIVSLVILSLTMVGLINLILAGRQYITHSRLRMTASELGKTFLDPKRMLVNQSTWSSNCLGLGSCPSETDSSGKYTATYTINRNSPIAGVNRVRVNITWPE